MIRPGTSLLTSLALLIPPCWTPGSPYTVTYSYTTDGIFDSTSDAAHTLTVDPKTLTASIVTDPTRAYDGHNEATLAPSNFSITGLVGSESFTVTQTAGTYNSKDINATTVTTSLATDQ